MNKQVLIEKLKEEKEKNHVRCVVANPAAIEVNNTFYQVDKALETAINYAEKLDEPQKAIAQLAEKWHEDIGPVLWWDFPVEEPPYCGTPLDDDFPKYKTHFTELHIPDEVEEKPKWKIINDQKYCLTSIEAGYGNSLHWAFDSTKKKPILFDNEETALYTAYITGGKVEKV